MRATLISSRSYSTTARTRPSAKGSLPLVRHEPSLSTHTGNEWRSLSRSWGFTGAGDISSKEPSSSAGAGDGVACLGRSYARKTTGQATSPALRESDAASVAGGRGTAALLRPSDRQLRVGCRRGDSVRLLPRLLRRRSDPEWRPPA